MALDSIEIDTTAEANVIYDVIATSGKQCVRSDAARSLAEPRLLEISHQEGSASRPDRHLIRFTQTEQSSTDESRFETASIHLVATVPRSVVTTAQVSELVKKLIAWGTTDNVAAWLRGSLG